MTRTMSLFAVAFAIAIGFGVWTSAPAKAPVMPVGIEPMKLMTAAKNLPTDEFVDYSVVFN